MTIKTQITKYQKIDIDLDLDVTLLDSRIYTTSVLVDCPPIIENWEEDEDAKYLCICVEVSLEEFESLTEGAAYARPRLLILYGILSFFTQEVFTPFGVTQTHNTVGELRRTTEEKFKFNGSDLLPRFQKLAEFIDANPDKKILYSLLDRWRKALYLEKEGEDNMIHDDEIVLSYFHILELLATVKYYPEQKSDLEKSIEAFTRSIFKNTFFITGQALDQQVNDKKRMMENFLIPQVSVTQKISYMLNKLRMLDERLQSFISNLVADRNSVAHGRQVYQDRVIYPVPPFFPLTKDRNYPNGMLRVLSGRIIAEFIGIDLFEEEWDEFSEDFLLPTIEEVKSFIKEKQYEQLTNDEFCNGDHNSITPYSITYYLINRNSKLKIKQVTPVFEKFIEDYSKTEEETIQSILAVILIADEAEPALQEKCKEIIKTANENGWKPHINFRDTFYYLEYCGFKPNVLKQMLIDRVIR